ncbi:protein FAM153A isoform X2 [Macaca nemestrina]|uniref:protein FAM153A isoform X2 n=1 Tax=Macaca nemestrina TaxID=9545 RepID=UPI0039B89FF0
MSWEMLGQVSTPGARTQGLLGPWSEVPLVNDPADITRAQRASEPQLRGASASACSVEDPRAGPGVPRESSVRRRRRKKRNLRRWCPSCVRPRVVPMEDHEDLAREPSSEDVPGVHMVDKATQTKSDKEHQEEDVPGQTSSEEATGVHMMRVDPTTLAKKRDEDLLCEHPLKILSEMLLGSFEKSIDVETEDPQEDLAVEYPHETPVERVLSVINAETFTETNGDLEDLEEDVPEQTSSEEASGVHMMRVDPATLAKIPPGHLQAWSSDSEDEEDPEDVEKSSGVTEKERDEDLLCEHPLKILSEMLLGSFEKSFDVETEDPQEDLAAEHPCEAPVERVLSVINGETFTETNGDLDDLQEDVPEQTSSEEASGVHMMRVDPATLAKIPPGHLQAWSSDSEDEEDPEDVEKSSGVTQKERDEDLLCEHPLKILSEMLLGSFEKSFDVETEDPQEDLAVEYPHETPVERVLSVINGETFTETNGDLDDLQEDVPEQTSSEEASGVHMMRVDPATLAKIPPGHLQAWSSDSEDEEDPEDVERSSGVTQKELEDSTMTGSRQQMSASSSSAPAEEATEKTKVEEEVKTSKKTRKPRKKTWRNVLSRWDIFNIF